MSTNDEKNGETENQPAEDRSADDQSADHSSPNKSSPNNSSPNNWWPGSPLDFASPLNFFLKTSLGNSGVGLNSMAGPADADRSAAAVRNLRQQVTQALENDEGGAVAQPPDTAERERLERNARLAELWVGELTATGSVSGVEILSREQWIDRTVNGWWRLTHTFADQAGAELSRQTTENLPPPLQALTSYMEPISQEIGAGIFTSQLSQILAFVAPQIYNGSDLFLDLQTPPNEAPGRPIFVLENLLADSSGPMEAFLDELQIVLCAREIAWVALQHHAPWLRHQLQGQLSAIARRVEVDHQALDEIPEDFDPMKFMAGGMSELPTLFSGSLRLQLPVSAGQEFSQALHLLALIAGWATFIAVQATARLTNSIPGAYNGLLGIVHNRSPRLSYPGDVKGDFKPGENAGFNFIFQAVMGSLYGVLPERNLVSDSYSLWQSLTEELGAEQRDRLWNHPDLMPNASDLEDPTTLIKRLGKHKTAPQAAEASVASEREEPETSSAGDLTFEQELLDLLEGRLAPATREASPFSEQSPEDEEPEE